MPNADKEKIESGHNWRLIGVAVLAIAIGTIVFFGRSHTRSGCQPYRVDKMVTVGQQEIAAEVADTQAERAKGLGGRKCITDNEGMLFIFDKPGRYALWMKGMKFPIDMVWIGSDHKVAGIQFDVAPSTYPDRFVNKDRPAQYVLEIKANRARSLGLTFGTPVNF